MPTLESTEEVPTEATLENRRTRSHRFIAMGSFVYLAAQGAVITAALVFSDEREAISAVFTGLSPFMIATNAMFVSVVLAFFGASTIEKVQLGK